MQTHVHYGVRSSPALRWEAGGGRWGVSVARGSPSTSARATGGRLLQATPEPGGPLLTTVSRDASMGQCVIVQQRCTMAARCTGSCGLACTCCAAGTMQMKATARAGRVRPWSSVGMGASGLAGIEAWMHRLSHSTRSPALAQIWPGRYVSHKMSKYARKYVGIP